MLLDDLYKIHRKGFLKQRVFKEAFDIQAYPLIFDRDHLTSARPDNGDSTYKKLIETFDFKFIDQSIISFILNSYQKALNTFAIRKDIDTPDIHFDGDHSNSFIKIYKYPTQYFKNGYSSIDRKLGITYLGIQNQLLFDSNGSYTKQIIRFQLNDGLNGERFKYMEMGIIFRNNEITIEYPKEMLLSKKTYSSDFFDADFQKLLNDAIFNGMYRYTFRNILKNVTGLDIPYTEYSSLFVKLIDEIHDWQNDNDDRYIHLVDFIESLSNELEVDEYIELIKDHMVVVDMMTI